MLPVVRVVVVVMLLVVFPVVRLELGVVAGDCGVFYQVFLFVLMALIWVLLLSMLLFFFFSFGAFSRALGHPIGTQ